MGTPFPEVTESICRVPSLYFFRAPWFIQPAYLCRFEYGLFKFIMSFLEFNSKGNKLIYIPPYKLNSSI